MSPITTHVLDTALGKPAAGVAIELHRVNADESVLLARGETDSDGRIMTWPADFSLEAGPYRLFFETAGYFAATGRQSFFPRVVIDFAITDATQHYHVPLLLSPFGYSTYRGN